MPNRETKRLQNFGISELKKIIPNQVDNTMNRRDKISVEIKKEWIPFDKREYPGMSSPIIDIAVGPFATGERRIGEYNELIKELSVVRFLRKAKEFHLENLKNYNIPENYVGLDDFENGSFSNKNARCFFAIEIEGREDRKVILSDIVNTSAMGRVGIIVSKSEKVLKIFCRLLYYQWYLKLAGKPNFIVSNVMILSEQQFKKCF